jgi:hypothetical protein
MAILNLIIDAHDPQPPGESPPKRKGLDAESQDKWFAELQNSREKLKEEGISTLFVGIHDYSRIYPANQPRDPALLDDLHLTRVNPRLDEDVFVKRYMDAFTDIDDVLKKPALRNYIDGEIVNGQRVGGERPDNEEFHNKIVDGSIKKEDFFGRPTLDDHLKTLGVDQITIMGGMAGFCITGTALSAALHGLDVTIISDRVLGWEDKNYKQVVWHPNLSDFHKREINDALDEVIRNPELRGFQTSDRQALIEAKSRIKICNFSEYTASLEPPTPSAIRNGRGSRPAPR